MKKIMILSVGLLAFSLFLTPALAEEKGSKIKSGVKSLVSDTVSAGKDVMSGIAEGVDEGRHEAESSDGAKVAASREDIDKLKLRFEITKVNVPAEDGGRAELTLALYNPNDFPVRLTNLNVDRNVVLLDDEGFSYPLDKSSGGGRDVTALGRSATRLRFAFTGLEAKPAIFRFFDQDLKITDQSAKK